MLVSNVFFFAGRSRSSFGRSTIHFISARSAHETTRDKSRWLNRSKLVPRSLGLISTGTKHNSTPEVEFLSGLFFFSPRFFLFLFVINLAVKEMINCSDRGWVLLQYQSEVVNIVYLFVHDIRRGSQCIVGRFQIVFSFGQISFV